MRPSFGVCVAALLLGCPAGAFAQSSPVCRSYGPQTPRDVTSKAGTNPRVFPLAPAASAMNLCNIHFHVNAEHRAPGFSVSAGKGEHGGYKCNGTSKLTRAELEEPAASACKGVRPGDTIEVHWVYSSCAVAPGKGLGSCSSGQCANPTLRVEAQAFLVVNSSARWYFGRFDYSGAPVNGVHQPRSLPGGTGKPIVFRGSTTGPEYTEQKCSPLQATWSVRPACARIDVGSLHRWCKNNAFGEDSAHGVRGLVTALPLLDRMK